MKLVSACLLGFNVRYDGKNKLNKKVLKLSQKEELIPVCPEIFGNLKIPREPAEIRGKRVIAQSGKDITKQFQKGAKMVLAIAKSFKIKEAIFAQDSPSCGCGRIYDGTFSGKKIKGDGICTQLLKKNKIRVKSI